jgi:hypothetical protein
LQILSIPIRIGLPRLDFRASVADYKKPINQRASEPSQAADQKRLRSNILIFTVFDEQCCTADRRIDNSFNHLSRKHRKGMSNSLT